MDDSPNSSEPLWFPKRDKNGGVFKKNIAQAALKDWDRLREYAARRRIDSSFAADILENIVKSMSAGRHRSSGNAVRNPESYIFARFARRIKRLAIKERRVDYVGTLNELASYTAAQDWEWPLRVMNSIRVREIISYMDPETRSTYWLRTQGLSWKEVARRQGTLVNTATKAYERGLERTRERMRLTEQDEHGS